MLKNIKTYLVTLTIFIVLALFGWKYVGFLTSQSDKLRTSYYQKQALQMRQDVKRLILQQQMLTMLISQTLSSSKRVAMEIVNKQIATSKQDQNYFKTLTSKIQADGLYKDLWIQIIDKNLNSLYRSWSHKRGDNLSKLQKELVVLKKTKRKITSISIGHFTISIKAISPVFYHNKFVGAVEVISHFSPIVHQLNTSYIDSIVLGKKTYKQQLSDSNITRYLHDYFIADNNTSQKIINYLTLNGVQKYCNTKYSVKQNNLIVCYKLKNVHSQTVGYFIMFAKISHMTNVSFKYFTFKWIIINIIAIILLLLLFIIKLYYSNKKQKKYYKKIIDLSNNVIIVTHKEKILEVNKAFYNYFNSNISLNDICITNYFVLEDSYLQPHPNGLLWIYHILLHPDKNYKIKIKLKNKIYYFLVYVAIMSKEKYTYSIVLTDITTEEIYQQKLKYLTITDTLTNIKNRYYFNTIIKDELQRAKRYKYPISLIMFDIDFFKDVNDKYGHDVGDKVLVTYTKLISSMLRSNDIFCRVGGEEFIIIAPYADLKNATIMAQKIRQQVQDFKQIVSITVSLGVTQYSSKENIEHLLKRVDKALYKAKENGRNRVEEG